MGIGRKQTDGAPAAHQAQPDALSVLLDTERELTEFLARADEEAAQIIEGARLRILDSERSSEDRLAEDLRALDAAEEKSTADALAAAAADGQAECRRLDAVPERRIQELADAILLDFLDVSPLTAGP